MDPGRLLYGELFVTAIAAGLLWLIARPFRKWGRVEPPAEAESVRAPA